MLDWQNLTFDPTTGQWLPPDPTQVRPEPARTVWAFQPRELDGAVITAPTLVNVEDFRDADDGDTAKLKIYGVPPATPLTLAPNPTPETPQLGQPVTSIGFPGLNLTETDGINLNDLFETDANLAKVLEDSRLQPVSTSGTITSQQYRNGVAVYQTNADLDSGTSGGPTVNSRGQVIGINSKMTIPFFGQNYNIITDTGMLRDFLDIPDLPVPTGAPGNVPTALATNTQNHFTPVEWTGLIVLALIGTILGAGTTWLFHRAHTRSPSTSTRKAENNKDSAPADTRTKHRPLLNGKPHRTQ